MGENTETDEVIHSPWERFSSNDTDGEFISRKGLEKEYLLTQYCFKFGLPVPEIYRLHFGEQVDFIIQEFVTGEVPTEEHLKEVGQLAYKLHNIELSSGLVQNAHNSLSTRILDRTEATGKLLDKPLLLPSSSELEKLFNSYPSKHKLLHLDIRPQNLIISNSKIVAIFDWTNALIGDPVLELMRMKDYGLLNSNFIKGYYTFNEELDRVPKIIRYLYQYDTALMLTLLFLTELNDQKQGEQAKSRLLDLYSHIRSQL